MFVNGQNQRQILRLRNETGTKNSLRSIDLINSLEKSEIAFHCIPQLSSLETGPPPINSNDNVLMPASKIMVPISTKGKIHQLTRWSTISVRVVRRETSTTRGGRMEHNIAIKNQRNRHWEVDNLQSEQNRVFCPSGIVHTRRKKFLDIQF